MLLHGWANVTTPVAGEVLAHPSLSVDRVRWLRQELIVDRQLLTPPRGAPAFAPTKTEKSNRIVPAPAELLGILAQHVEGFGPGPDALVFHDRGRPWRRSRFEELWRAARLASGVEARFHELRHYCASLLIASGLSVKGVHAVLGHASATETLDVYAHLWPDEHDRTREAMRTGLARSAGSTRDALNEKSHLPGR
jgi:integrase